MFRMFHTRSVSMVAVVGVSLALAACGNAADGKDAAAPGADAADAGKTNVGILLLDKPFITEFAGPLDVYHHVPADKMNVFVVSDTDKEQTTYEGLPFHANYTIANAPHVDVLVVPSGGGSLSDDPKNGPVIDWIKSTAKDAQYVTSHCEGAFLLGAAGLLDGKNATTFHTDTSDLQSRTPQCTVVNGQRIVVDGNLITSAGGLASYEAALYVVEKLYGKEQADTIATALVFGESNVKEAMA
ncbi:MAG: DJ-1/PfpI family protein, partial [Ardenticatenales bacterium]